MTGYDGHQYCDACGKHQAECWCHPDQPFSDPGRVETDLCDCPLVVALGAFDHAHVPATVPVTGPDGEVIGQGVVDRDERGIIVITLPAEAARVPGGYSFTWDPGQ